MKKILIIGDENHGRQIAKDLKKTDVEVFIYDKKKKLQTIDIEEFKKVADQIIYLEQLVIPEKFTIADIDAKILQFESKLNKRAKKWLGVGVH